MRIDPASLDTLLHPTLDEKSSLNVIASGLPASPGAASGKVVFNSEEAERLNHMMQDQPSSSQTNLILMSDEGQDVIYDSTEEDGFQLKVGHYNQNGTMMSSDQFNKAREEFQSDREFYNYMSNIAGASVDDLFTGASYQVGDPHFPSVVQNRQDSTNNRNT